MATWKISVDTPYSFPGSPTTEYTYSPEGCFRSPYSHRFDSSKENLYLIHRDGETLLGGGWSGYDLEGFSVKQLEECESEPYDCLNGSCVKAEVYSTPGLYETISDCEKACGSGCSGKCLSKDEWRKIQDLAKKLKDKNCS